MEIEKLKQIFRQYLLGQARDKESDTIDAWYQSFNNEPVAPLSREAEENIRLTQNASMNQILPIRMH